ncbi:hypothetical protein C0J52_24571 [Blattella germanica]|nr:hypothetical protein C0J52_24571 [Blattella germanica]
MPPNEQFKEIVSTVTEKALSTLLIQVHNSPVSVTRVPGNNPSYVHIGKKKKTERKVLNTKELGTRMQIECLDFTAYVTSGVVGGRNGVGKKREETLKCEMYEGGGRTVTKSQRGCNGQKSTVGCIRLENSRLVIKESKDIEEDRELGARIMYKGIAPSLNSQAKQLSSTKTIPQGQENNPGDPLYPTYQAAAEEGLLPMRELGTKVRKKRLGKTSAAYATVKTLLGGMSFHTAIANLFTVAWQLFLSPERAQQDLWSLRGHTPTLQPILVLHRNEVLDGCAGDKGLPLEWRFGNKDISNSINPEQIGQLLKTASSKFPRNMKVVFTRYNESLPPSSPHVTRVKLTDDVRLKPTPCPDYSATKSLPSPLNSFKAIGHIFKCVEKSRPQSLQPLTLETDATCSVEEARCSSYFNRQNSKTKNSDGTETLDRPPPHYCSCGKLPSYYTMLNQTTTKLMRNKYHRLPHLPNKILLTPTAQSQRHRNTVLTARHDECLTHVTYKCILSTIITLKGVGRGGTETSACRLTTLRATNCSVLPSANTGVVLYRSRRMGQMGYRPCRRDPPAAAKQQLPDNGYPRKVLRSRDDAKEGRSRRDRARQSIVSKFTCTGGNLQTYFGGHIIYFSEITTTLLFADDTAMYSPVDGILVSLVYVGHGAHHMIGHWGDMISRVILVHASMVHMWRMVSDVLHWPMPYVSVVHRRRGFGHRIRSINMGKITPQQQQSFQVGYSCDIAKINNQAKCNHILFSSHLNSIFSCPLDLLPVHSSQPAPRADLVVEDMRT